MAIDYKFLVESHEFSIATRCEFSTDEKWVYQIINRRREVKWKEWYHNQIKSSWIFLLIFLHQQFFPRARKLYNKLKFVQHESKITKSRILFFERST